MKKTEEKVKRFMLYYWLKGWKTHRKACLQLSGYSADDVMRRFRMQYGLALNSELEIEVLELDK